MFEVEPLHHPDPLVCVMYTLCMYHCTFFILQELDKSLPAEDETKEDIKVCTSILYMCGCMYAHTYVHMNYVAFFNVYTYISM